jgi:hypothetical protein
MSKDRDHTRDLDAQPPRPAAADRTYGDHLRHVAEHAGTVPMEHDAFGRCATCVRLGWLRADA